MASSQLNKKDRQLYMEFLQDTLYPSGEPMITTTTTALNTTNSNTTTPPTNITSSNSNNKITTRSSSSSIFISKNISSSNVSSSSYYNTGNSASGTNHPLDFDAYDYLNLLNMDDPDDEQNDPDFILPGHENADQEDREYDSWIHVPKKEAVDLVKDAIEHQDILGDEVRNSRHKSRRFMMMVDTEPTPSTTSQQQQQQSNTGQYATCSLMNTSSSNNLFSNLDTTTTSTDVDDERSEIDTDLDLNENGEYVPKFNRHQRNQLEEQLRNHVQIATQVCLATYCSKEHKTVYSQSLNLLKDLKNLKQSDLMTELGERHIQLASDFDIRNLDEALQVIDDISKMDHAEFNVGPHNELKMPKQFLQTILTSPVFYNIYLLPSTNKSSVCVSIFKKSQFCDAEKVLVTLGFNKFKHLDRQQTVECIQKYMMPHKSCDEIKKQINSIIDNEERQKKLKSLLVKQRHEKMNTLEHDYEFDPEIHYKSPLEQANRARLPSMYSMMIESLRMEEIKRQVREAEKIKGKKQQKEASITLDSSDIENSGIDVNGGGEEASGLSIEENRDKQNVVGVLKERVTTTTETTTAGGDRKSSQRQRKRIRSPTPPPPPPPSSSSTTISSLSFGMTTPDRNMRTTSHQQTISIDSTPPVSIQNVNMSTPSNNSVPIVYSASNMMQLLSNPASMIQPLMSHPSSMVFQSGVMNSQTTQQQQQRQQMLQHPQLASAIPPNFNGVILFQPTFYVQCVADQNKSQTKKFRQIMPKAQVVDKNKK